MQTTSATLTNLIQSIRNQKEHQTMNMPTRQSKKYRIDLNQNVSYYNDDCFITITISSTFFQLFLSSFVTAAVNIHSFLAIQSNPNEV